MTEKEIYKNGVALLEEWEDVNYCEHSFKFKDEWLTDKEVVDLLKQLNDENEELKQVLGSILIEVKRQFSTHTTSEIRVFINPNSFNLISEVLREYGALKEGYE